MVGWQQGLGRAAEVEAKGRLVMGVQGKQATPGASVRSQERRLQWLVTVSFRAVLVGHELPPWSCRWTAHAHLSRHQTIGAGGDGHDSLCRQSSVKNNSVGTVLTDLYPGCEAESHLYLLPNKKLH